MGRIEEIRHLKNANGTFIVAASVEDENEIRIFENESEEYVMSKGYNKIKICTSKKEAEKAVRSYMYRNCCYLVRETPNGLEVIRHEGVITTAPIGTLAVCKKKKQAKRLCRKLEKQRAVYKENLNKTA